MPQVIHRPAHPIPTGHQPDPAPEIAPAIERLRELVESERAREAERRERDAVRFQMD